MNLPLQYEQPLFRPPSEANSLIFQVTLGCTWNKCAFCEMYGNKKFTTKSLEDITKEINEVSSVTTDIRKVFLADGNALALSTKRFLDILSALNNSFPRLNRISAYALPANLSSKTLEELVSLREAGLKMVYVGIESGDDEVLGYINKSETFDSTAEGLLKAKEAGIKVSAIILNGVAGLKYSEQHAINSAKVLNRIQPEFASSLVLSFPMGIERYKERFKGEYVPMTTHDLIKEMDVLISHTELEQTIYRSNHASNYLVLSGVLGRDKQNFLDNIRFALNNPEVAGLREEWQRGL